MSRFVAALVLLASLSTPCLAQDRGNISAAMHTFVSANIEGMLRDRANQTWTPIIYAGPQTAKSYLVIAGLAVQVDPALTEGTIEVRTLKNVFGPRGDIVAKAGDVMISIVGAK